MSSVAVEACERAGYRTRRIDDLLIEPNSLGRPAQSAGSERVLTIWDVPVLEPGWPDQLERRARLTGPVIALLGFADRASVTLARARGAAACLELPFDLDDLLYLIDRAVETRPLDSVAGAGAVRAAPSTAAALRDAAPPEATSSRPDRRGQITTASLQFPERS